MSEPRPGGLALKFAAGTAVLAVLFAILSAVLGERATPTLGATDGSNVVGGTGYQDRFVSGVEENFRVTGTARLRDLPTTGGSSVLETLSAGAVLSGKRVWGANGSSQWVRTDRGGTAGYLWMGNLETVAAAPEPVVDSAPETPSGNEGRGDEVAAAAPAAPAERRARGEDSEPQAGAAPGGRKASRRSAAKDPTAVASGVPCLLPLGQQARMSADECTRQGGVTMDD